MRKAVLSSAVLGFVAALFVSVSSVSAAPYCGITWGSGVKTAGATTTRSLTNIRTGQHDCYDRMVFDVSGTSATGYRVEYVSNVYADPSGQLISLSGGAKLRVVVNSPVNNGSTVTYNATVGKTLPGVNLAGYQTFKDAKFAGSFEGKTSVGLGVRALLPFRVTVSENHVIVDVAHYW
jgi:hypothetical protein